MLNFLMGVIWVMDAMDLIWWCILHKKPIIVISLDFALTNAQYYSVSANEISFDKKKISQSAWVFQTRLGLEEDNSPLHLVTSTGFLKA